MEIRSSEEIGRGEDLTPPLPPLTVALHRQSPLSSDIAAALNLYQSLPPTSTPIPPRLFGLLTNHQSIISSDDPDILSAIRDGTRQLAAALNHPSDDLALEESLLCLIMTNAVEVTDQSTGQTLGIAVYDHNFSWINHSCSPNACYRFLFSHSNPNNNSTMRIRPASFNSLQGETNVTNLLPGQGDPSIVVRSIKKINKGEAITIAYTDLLQPKAMRQSELWTKYRFVCSCERCSALPPTYVDRVLEEISAFDLEMNSRLDCNFNSEEANKKSSDYMDEVIDDYLSVGDPESCCNKLESFLNHGLQFDQSETDECRLVLNLRVNPLHHLALNAYTTLSSVYKVRSSNSSPLNSDINAFNQESFDMSRISAAYSLLLAGATNHLYQSEPSLIASAANFWVNAGEALLTLAGSSTWNLKSSLEKYKCLKCSLMDKLDAYVGGNMSCTFLDCISDLSHKVWTDLSHGCIYLQMCTDPIGFRWLQSSSINIHKVSNFVSKQELLHSEEVQISVVFQLGVHCLLYGGYLSNICYGDDSHLACQIHNILHIQ